VILETAERDGMAAHWPAMMLALDLDTCRSILQGRRVRAGNLDGSFFGGRFEADRCRTPRTTS